MYAFLNEVFAVLMSILMSFSFFTSMPMTTSGQVDEQELSLRYQSGSWSGTEVTGFGHTAEVKDGLLFIDGEQSEYPADSSVANSSKPIYSNEDGTWFEDHERNEIRQDLRGENIFTFRFSKTVALKDLEDWTTQLKGEDIYVYSGDTLMAVVYTADYGVSASVYGPIC